MYERGHRIKLMQPYDISGEMIKEYATREQVKYMTTHRKLMHQLRESKGVASPLDWLIVGMHYAKSADEEVAYQAYYMAHLLDHENIETNAKMKFETSV